MFFCCDFVVSILKCFLYATFYYRLCICISTVVATRFIFSCYFLRLFLFLLLCLSTRSFAIKMLNQTWTWSLYLFRSIINYDQIKSMAWLSGLNAIQPIHGQKMFLCYVWHVVWSESSKWKTTNSIRSQEHTHTHTHIPKRKLINRLEIV